MTDLDALQSQLQYQFNDITLLERALSHRSVGAQNNERLEFLGDAVLGLIMADELYHGQSQSREGALSRVRSTLVNGDTLAQMARVLGIRPYIKLGTGERRSGGENRDSILADAMEAIIGAIYIDAGLRVCHRCVLAWYATCLPDVTQLPAEKDAKSTLQEWLQARKLPLPDYEATVTGEAHAQTFFVTVRVSGMSLEAQGQSTSRRKAEQLAAAQFLEKLRQENE